MTENTGSVRGPMYVDATPLMVTADVEPLVHANVAELQSGLIGEADVQTAFADFGGLWASLSPREQRRVIHLLVARVEFDAVESAIDVTFHATGIQALAHEPDSATEDAA